VLAQLTVSAEAAGYRQVRQFARRAAAGRRLWVIEGTGSYGAGLTAFLLEHGEAVVEIDRPARPARRNGAKSDELDAGGLPARHWRASIWPSRGAAAIARPCGCCCRPGMAP
jgi:hypothetical protein